jgi:hypothetical protein
MTKAIHLSKWKIHHKGYQSFVSIENGKRVISSRLVKALHGYVKLALLWYELFTGTLTGLGFVLNSLLGHGVFLTKSSKQKLNTKSLTKAELVGAT